MNSTIKMIALVKGVPSVEVAVYVIVRNDGSFVARSGAARRTASGEDEDDEQ